MVEASEVGAAMRNVDLSGRQWTFGVLAILGVAGSIALSLASHIPAELPGVALGSPALLYVERAVASFTAYLLALVVVVRAFDGDLPSELRGLKYDIKESRETAAEGITDLSAANLELRERLENLEALLGVSEAE
jgi:hypothetical protein